MPRAVSASPSRRVAGTPSQRWLKAEINTLKRKLRRRAWVAEVFIPGALHASQRLKVSEDEYLGQMVVDLARAGRPARVARLQALAEAGISETPGGRLANEVTVLAPLFVAFAEQLGFDAASVQGSCELVLAAFIVERDTCFVDAGHPGATDAEAIAESHRRIHRVVTY